MALPVIGVEIYIEDTGLATSNQTSLVTTLGGSNTIDTVSLAELGDIKQISKAPLNDIGKIMTIDFRTAGSTTLYFHTEDHASITGYENMETPSADVARVTYTRSANDTDIYPNSQTVDEWASEDTYTEIIPSETWSNVIRKKCTVGCSSLDYAGLIYSDLYKRDSGGTETLLSSLNGSIGTTTEGNLTLNHSVTTELVADYIVVKLSVYFYEIGGLT